MGFHDQPHEREVHAIGSRCISIMDQSQCPSRSGQAYTGSEADHPAFSAVSAVSIWRQSPAAAVHGDPVAAYFNSGQKAVQSVAVPSSHESGQRLDAGDECLFHRKSSGLLTANKFFWRLQHRYKTVRRREILVLFKGLDQFGAGHGGKDEERPVRTGASPVMAARSADRQQPDGSVSTVAGGRSVRRRRFFNRGSGKARQCKGHRHRRLSALIQQPFRLHVRQGQRKDGLSLARRG